MSKTLDILTGFQVCYLIWFCLGIPPVSFATNDEYINILLDLSYDNIDTSYQCKMYIC